ncbi:MAG: biotin/lipoyl-binding protein, partial [bacterium]|nr:biotin/lipoyl-binding protein [bacterium]
MISTAKGRVYGFITLAVISGFAFTAHQRNTAGKAAEPQQKKTPLVMTAPVQLGSIAKSIETTGTAEAENSVNIVPKLDQRIAWMPLREGDQVRQGQLIVRLEAAEATDQLAAAQAEASVAEARLRDVLAGSRPQEIRSAKAALA